MVRSEIFEILGGGIDNFHEKSYATVSFSKIQGKVVLGIPSMYFVVKVGGTGPQHAHIERRPIFLIRKNSFSILLYIVK